VTFRRVIPTAFPVLRGLTCVLDVMSGIPSDHGAALSYKIKKP